MFKKLSIAIPLVTSLIVPQVKATEKYSYKEIYMNAIMVETKKYIVNRHQKDELSGMHLINIINNIHEEISFGGELHRMLLSGIDCTSIKTINESINGKGKLKNISVDFDHGSVLIRDTPIWASTNKLNSFTIISYKPNSIKYFISVRFLNKQSFSGSVRGDIIDIKHLDKLMNDNVNRMLTKCEGNILRQAI